MDNNILIGGAVLLGLYMFMGGEKEPRFMVPGVGYVPESQLPSMGYVKVAGKWYSQSQVDAAAAQAGVSAGTVPSGSSAWNAIAAILAAAIPLVTTIVNNSGGNSGGSMAGIYGPTKHQCSKAGQRLATRGFAVDGRQLAMCRR